MALGPAARLCVLGPQPPQRAVCPPAQPSPSSCSAGRPSSLPTPGGQAREFQGDHLAPWPPGRPRAHRKPGVRLPPWCGGGALCSETPSLGPKGGEGQVNPAVCPLSLQRRKRECSPSDVPAPEGALRARSSRSVLQAHPAPFLGTAGGPSCLCGTQLLPGQGTVPFFLRDVCVGSGSFCGTALRSSLGLFPDRGCCAHERGRPCVTLQIQSFGGRNVARCSRRPVGRRELSPCR